MKKISCVIWGALNCVTRPNLLVIVAAPIASGLGYYSLAGGLIVAAFYVKISLIHDAIKKAHGGKLEMLDKFLDAEQAHKSQCMHDWRCVGDGKHGREEEWKCRLCGERERRP